MLRRFQSLDGQSAAPVCAVYEPETYLFGGPRSMRLVHELFTADSLAWLDHHTSDDAGALADWRLSLALLGELLDGLGVAGWEHRGVWEVARDDTGRGLGTGLGEDTDRAAAGIRDAWNAGPRTLLAPLPAARRSSVEAHAHAVRRGADRWRTEYVESGGAVVGPRRAAALLRDLPLEPRTAVPRPAEPADPRPRRRREALRWAIPRARSTPRHRAARRCSERHGSAGVPAVADAVDHHARVPAAAELKARLLGRLSVRLPEPGALGQESRGLLGGASGALCALLTAAHGAPRTWPPCLGLR
ncbi:lantibiotic dehydratase C-terminal domain-containing protein [Streptomyces monashensis]|uniref:lantibiotic dehydratase C-terminal domain-containing protein n=1 Tax=Streptomyces monashensis TaxID=1678012 RepID=UPI00340E6F9F